MGNRIRELRKNNGLTMKQLGQQIGLAESTISQYETGKRSPDNETLLKLGEIFGVTVGYILGSEEEETTPGEQTLTEGEKALLELFRKIPADQQEMVLQMIRVALNAAK